MREFLYNNVLAIVILITTIGGFLWGTGVAIWKIATWKSNTDKDLSTFSEFMKEVRNDIKEILKHVSPGQPLTKAESPIRLTAFGERITNEIDAHALAEQHVETVIATIPGRNP